MKQIKVVPYQGSWSVGYSGNDPLKLFQAKEDGEVYASALAKAAQAEVIVYDKFGSIESRMSFARPE